MKTSVKELRKLVGAKAIKDYSSLSADEKKTISRNRKYDIAYASGVYGLNAVLKMTAIGLVVAFDNDIYKIGS